jgi:hypothetical protein
MTDLKLYADEILRYYNAEIDIKTVSFLLEVFKAKNINFDGSAEQFCAIVCEILSPENINDEKDLKAITSILINTNLAVNNCSKKPSKSIRNGNAFHYSSN